jgi:hypothetical protein
VSDPLDDAPEMVPFVTGEELERRRGETAIPIGAPFGSVLTRDQELATKGKVAHTTQGGLGSVGRLRTRRRLERPKR